VFCPKLHSWKVSEPRIRPERKMIKVIIIKKNLTIHNHSEKVLSLQKRDAKGFYLCKDLSIGKNWPGGDSPACIREQYSFKIHRKRKENVH
jgi:hypothetical protein